MTLATVEERPMTNAARQKARLEAFMGAVASRSEQFQTLLQDANIEPRLFIETCRRAIMRDVELLDCDPGSFIQAAMNCAGDGLVPDGRKAAFVRYKRNVQYVPMYQGLLEIAYRAGNFQSIEGQVVYKGDTFDYALGDKPFINHTRSLESDGREIIGAYAVGKTTNGGVFREVVGKKDLAQIRAVSRAKNGPNADWPGEMARKAALRRLWKWLPKTPAMERVLEHDDATYEKLAPVAEVAPRLHADFEAPAIEQQATEDVTPTIDAILDGDEIPEPVATPSGDDAGQPEGEESAQAGPPLTTGSDLLKKDLANRAKALADEMKAAETVEALEALWAGDAQLRGDLAEHAGEWADRLAVVLNERMEALT